MAGLTTGSGTFNTRAVGGGTATVTGAGKGAATAGATGGGSDSGGATAGGATVSGAIGLGGVLAAASGIAAGLASSKHTHSLVSLSCWQAHAEVSAWPFEAVSEGKKTRNKRRSIGGIKFISVRVGKSNRMQNTHSTSILLLSDN
jgi:hypothetical protein